METIRRSERNLVRVVDDPRGAAGRHGRVVRGLLGIRHRDAVAVPVRLVQELDAPARHQQDLGREPVAVLAVLLPAPRLQLAVDVDEPALPRVLLDLVSRRSAES